MTLLCLNPLRLDLLWAFATMTLIPAVTFQGVGGPHSPVKSQESEPLLTSRGPGVFRFGTGTSHYHTGIVWQPLLCRASAFWHLLGDRCPHSFLLMQKTDSQLKGSKYQFILETRVTMPGYTDLCCLKTMLQRCMAIKENEQ